MASSPCNSMAEPAIIEQVVTEFFAKSLHIILESRSPFVSSRNYSGDPFISSSPSSSSSSSSGRPRDKWFNLALRDCPAALENFDLWRQSNLEPLVVDVILARRPSAQDVAHPYSGGCLVRNLSSKDQHWASGLDDFVPQAKTEKIVERWIVQYECRNSSSSISRESFSGSKKSSRVASQSSEIPALYKKTYKRTIVLLRSLYVTVRLLPAYKVFRALNSSGQIRPFSLSHRISSFVEPFTRVEDAEMNQFSFAPVDTPCGRLSLSVSYLPTLEDVSSEPSTPLSAQLITDYVGSPTTDPLKRFQSLPSAGPVPTVSMTRRHSWSNDWGATPPASPSPSPTYSDSRALHCHPNPSMPQFPISHDAFVADKNSTSFDEYWPSPPFSPSSSPSPPTHSLSGHLPNALLRSESAPVSIPSPGVGRNSGLPNQALPPYPPKVTRLGCSSQPDTLRAQVPTISVSQTSSSESRPRMTKESPRLGDFQTGVVLQKVLSFGKGEVGNLPGLYSSPHIPFSRSHKYFLDEFDDPDFTCPFAVDDEDLTNSCNRMESSDGKVHESGKSESGGLQLVKRSPDAVVGALVRLFKSAPPLHHDPSDSIRTLLASKDEIWNESIQDMEVGVVRKLDSEASSFGITASGLFKSRTAADALEELRSYKEMKESLLRHGGSHSSLDADCGAKSAGGGGPSEF